VFSSFGPVLKIAIFDKNGGVQALILYTDVQTSVVAKEAMEGHCIYDGGFYKLRISYSRHTDLSIKAPPEIQRSPLNKNDNFNLVTYECIDLACSHYIY
nr:polypyrimidine tract-binding protein homolog 2 isoform X3 [Tanacetum cinerariifolium]